MIKPIRTYNDRLQDIRLKAVTKLVNFVGATLGPSGRNVILSRKHFRQVLNNVSNEEFFKPVITKDGVTVSNFIHADDEFEDAIIQTIKHAAHETNGTVGDGTTTATVLACAIVSEAQKYLYNEQTSPVRFKRGLEIGVADAVAAVKTMLRPVSKVEDLRNIAYISSNNDSEMADIISTAIEGVGADGAVKIEKAGSNETSLDLREGYRLLAGVMSDSLLTDNRRKTCNFEDAYLLIYDGVIDNINSIKDILGSVIRSSRPVIIIADDMSQAVLAMIINNVATVDSFNATFIKAPFYGEERRSNMQDLCVATGATYISKIHGKELKTMVLTDLGSVSSFEASKAESVFVGGKGLPEKVGERVEEIEAELVVARERGDDVRVLERLEERIVKLSSAVAIIYVGANNETELQEKVHRYEDALSATTAAHQEGIVAGGGTTYLRVANYLTGRLEDGIYNSLHDDEKAGVAVLIRSLLYPLHTIAKNAGESGDAICQNLTERYTDPPETGYDFAKRKYTNMFDDGIVDPAKVARVALEQAASAAGILLTADHCIVRHDNVEGRHSG